jgi:hypothetical protein
MSQRSPSEILVVRAALAAEHEQYREKHDEHAETRDQEDGPRGGEVQEEAARRVR